MNELVGWQQKLPLDQQKIPTGPGSPQICQLETFEKQFQAGAHLVQAKLWHDCEIDRVPAVASKPRCLRSKSCPILRPCQDQACNQPSFFCEADPIDLGSHRRPQPGCHLQGSCNS